LPQGEGLAGLSPLLDKTMTQFKTKPVRLEVIAPLLEGMGLCSSCNLVLGEAGIRPQPAELALDAYPQDWQDDQRRLTDWVRELAAHHGPAIRIEVHDPHSPGGLIRSLRYRVRRYPTWVVNGQRRIVGWDRQALDQALAAARQPR